jgi:hypothetical protein
MRSGTKVVEIFQMVKGHANNSDKNEGHWKKDPEKGNLEVGISLGRIFRIKMFGHFYLLALMKGRLFGPLDQGVDFWTD